MNSTPETDLERRLAARLQPVRVPGAVQAWAQIAPHLGRPGSGRAWRTLATAATVLVLVIALAAALNSLIFPHSGGGGGQYGTTPSTPQPAAQASLTIAPNMSIHGDRVLSLAPLPPFAVFQLTTPPEGMHLLTQAYDPGLKLDNQRLPAMGATSAAAGGMPPDSATRQAAEQLSNDLFVVGQEATLVLIYAATPDDLIGLVQRAATDKVLPTGDPITVRGLPGVRTQHDGRTTITWIEQGTYLVFTVNARTDEQLMLAETLVETAINIPPVALPASALPPPDPAADPTTIGSGTVINATFDREAVAQHCGDWDPKLHNISLDQIGCYAKAIIGPSGQEGIGIDRLPWSEAAPQLGIDPPNGPPADRLVWKVTFVTNTNNRAVTNATVILNTETGEPIAIIGSASNP